MAARSADGAQALPPSGRARWRASLWDYLAVLVWLAVLSVVGLVGRSVLPAATQAPTHPVLVADAAALVLTVLPLWACLTVAEAGPAQGSWGKRRGGLRVARPDGRPVGRGRAAVRNAVKLAPWQLAHVAVVRIVLEVDAPVTIAVTYALSLLIPAASIAMAWRDGAHRALHDRVAGTRVVRT